MGIRPARGILTYALRQRKPGYLTSNAVDIRQKPVSIPNMRNNPIDLECGRSFYVVRITEKRITAAAWRWDMEDWEKGAGWSAPGPVEQKFTLVEKRK